MATRLFFVTESKEDNEELHETLEAARNYINGSNDVNDSATMVIWIAVCTTAYPEEQYDGTIRWNYEDNMNCFTKIKQIN